VRVFVRVRGVQRAGKALGGKTSQRRSTGSGGQAHKLAVRQCTHFDAAVVLFAFLYATH